MTESQRAATMSFVEKLKRAHEAEIQKPTKKQKADRAAMERHARILRRA